jgi:threonine dehydratase
MPPGQLSVVDRESPEMPEDVFRCPGCTQEACQTSKGCAATSWRFEPDGYLRAILTARVYDVAVVTPLDKAVKLSDAIGNSVLLKREDLQPVFSFKLRGAYNKMAKLPKEALERGVITSSAGNHAQGVALAAQKLVGSWASCSCVFCEACETGPWSCPHPPTRPNIQPGPTPRLITTSRAARPPFACP